MTKCLVLSVGVPLVMGLVVPMVFVERIVKVAVQPVELGNNSEEEGILGEIVAVVVVPLANGVHHLVNIRVNDFVAKIVVGLLVEVLRIVRG